MTGHWPLPAVFWLKLAASFVVGATIGLLLAGLVVAAAMASPSKARDAAQRRCMAPIETIRSHALRFWCLKQSDKMP